MHARVTRYEGGTLEALDDAVETKKRALPTEFGQTAGLKGTVFLVDYDAYKARHGEASAAMTEALLAGLSEAVFQIDLEARWRFLNPTWEDDVPVFPSPTGVTSAKDGRSPKRWKCAAMGTPARRSWSRPLRPMVTAVTSTGWFVPSAGG